LVIGDTIKSVISYFATVFLRGIFNSSISFATESGAGTIMQSPGRGLFLPDFFPFWTLYSVLVELDLL
jgi:hypothetical protein